ncbi:DUF1707 domain-containing protein [Actinocorallia sp. API 0066]|uniref:DUF1707 SHOCT-like domain-containing protein n=1 Tax=Actinocorallia sp. API 0066 TaxID=2896846 RepID=UPI001E415FA7|nr:DUF1707 domain-containing protein [Actinocorallia sp. API 0066]MCD0450839.1 DUF1707 domain-containing protein [Actinocorallia sp. API 0066]
MDLEKKPDLRASDADRDAVAGLLGEALAEGRLTPEEHAERLDLLYAAKTYADLEPLTADLPSHGAQPRVSLVKREPEPVPPSRRPSSITTVLSGADRKGRWLVEPHTTITCVLGGVDLDFREAVLSQREVVVDVNCVLGGVDVKLPPGVRVEVDVMAILGGADDPRNDTVDPNAPIIRFTGFVLLGGLSFKRKLPREQRRELRRQRREKIRRDLGL